MINFPGHLSCIDLKRFQAGMTLLELMISLSLGLIMLAGISSIFIGSNQTYRVQEQSARIQETGRLALDVLGRSIRQAGADANMTVNPNARNVRCTPPVCTTITTDTSDLTALFAVQFYAGLDESNGTNWGARDCTGSFGVESTLITNAFTWSGTTISCAGTGTRTTGTLPTTVTAPLLANVEDVQLSYGVDTDNDQSANLYSATPTTAQWDDVVSVRACVLIRSEEQGITNTPQCYMNCAGALGIATGTGTCPGGNPNFTRAGDSRLRRAFVATFNLRNRVTLLP